MTVLAVLRHGMTAWSEEGRLQGRADPPLSPAGAAALEGRRLPPAFDDAAWHVSPLLRARQTASLLGAVDPAIEPRLIEMDYGSYQGRRLDELRAALGSAFAANEARGRDFLPPGGESPRMVWDRLRPWLAELAAQGGRHVAITHKGVIRILLAQAYDWPMLGRPPVRLDWRRLHQFRLDRDGRPAPEAMNIPLVRV